MSIKLTDAIAGNRNWIERAKKQQAALADNGNKLLEQARTLSYEIEARRKMSVAMQEVQDLMPKDETIKFLVPEEY